MPASDNLENTAQGGTYMGEYPFIVCKFRRAGRVQCGISLKYMQFVDLVVWSLA